MILCHELKITEIKTEESLSLSQFGVQAVDNLHCMAHRLAGASSNTLGRMIYDGFQLLPL